MGSILKPLKVLPVRLIPHLRLRHVRGHGIHSPFVFGLVRNTLMLRWDRAAASGPLYRLLREYGIGRLRAAQLQNLHNYCDYRLAAVFSAGAERCRGIWQDRGNGSGTLRIFTGCCPAELIELSKPGFSSQRGR